MDDVQLMFFLLGLLFVKHFIVDFVLQTSYQLQNKGIYGHPGGILHAGIHGLGTWMCLTLFVVSPYALFFGVVDAFIHYHIDWAKVKISTKYAWNSNQPEFWFFFGLDQLLHSVTYVIIIGLLAGAF